MLDGTTSINSWDTNSECFNFKWITENTSRVRVTEVKTSAKNNKTDVFVLKMKKRLNPRCSAVLKDLPDADHLFVLFWFFVFLDSRTWNRWTISVVCFTQYTMQIQVIKRESLIKIFDKTKMEVSHELFLRKTFQKKPEIFPSNFFPLGGLDVFD